MTFASVQLRRVRHRHDRRAQGHRRRRRADRDVHLPAAGARGQLPAGDGLHRQDRHAGQRAVRDRLRHPGRQEARALHPVRELRCAPLDPVLGRAGVQGDVRPRGHRADRARWRSATCRWRRARTSAMARPRVRFAPSPKMSTYLLFFGVGEFERATATSAATEVGVVTQAGSVEQARFALESSAASCPNTTTTSARRTRCPSSTTSPRPGGSQFFGAMENWGAIFTFEYALLLDPAISTPGGQAARLLDRRARDRAPVVRQPGDDELVGRPLAQRGLRLVDGRPHDREAASGVEHRAGGRGRCARRDGARRDGDHASGRAARGDRGAGQPGLRRDHLPRAKP